MKKTIATRVAACTATLLAGVLASSCYAQSAPGVYFVSPQNGASVPSTFTVKFGLTGKQIGTIGDLDQAKGHHHLIIDGGTIPLVQPVPSDERHKHFGGGQTQVELSLPPGKHTLTLQFADGAHRSYGAKPWSETISIEVAPKTKVTSTATPAS